MVHRIVFSQVDSDSPSILIHSFRGGPMTILKQILSFTLRSKWDCQVPGPVARSDARLPGMRTVAGSILGSGNIISWRLVKKPFLRPFSPYRWLRQLSVTGEKMCT